MMKLMRPGPSYAPIAAAILHISSHAHCFSAAASDASGSFWPFHSVGGAQLSPARAKFSSCVRTRRHHSSSSRCSRPRASINNANSRTSESVAAAFAPRANQSSSPAAGAIAGVAAAGASCRARVRRAPLPRVTDSSCVRARDAVGENYPFNPAA